MRAFGPYRGIYRASDPCRVGLVQLEVESLAVALEIQTHIERMTPKHGVKAVSGLHLLLATLALLMGLPVCADAAGIERIPAWAFSMGLAYSPTSYGADRSGTVFWTAAVSQLESRWALHAEVLHGRYANYPDVGSASFTPIGVGLRYSPFSSGPFLQFVPLFVLGNWGGSNSGISRVMPGVDVDFGVLLPRVGPGSIAFEVGYLATDSAGEVPTFDAPGQSLDGLGIFTMRGEVGLRFAK